MHRVTRVTALRRNTWHSVRRHTCEEKTFRKIKARTPCSHLGTRPLTQPCAKPGSSLSQKFATNAAQGSPYKPAAEKPSQKDKRGLGEHYFH